MLRIEQDSVDHLRLAAKQAIARGESVLSERFMVASMLIETQAKAIESRNEEIAGLKMTIASLTAS